MGKTSKLTLKLRRLGMAQGARHVLPVLAMELARAADEGRVKPDDALEVYVDYFKAASRLKTIDPYDNGVKANVSKLRQIIKAHDPRLLARVTKAHDKAARKSRVKPLYHAMVAACRYANANGRVPDAVLAELCRR
jgi:hypothetical protein